MPLSREEFDRLGKRMKPQRREFGKVFTELVGRQLYAIDERLREDVDHMGPFANLRPLPDADRVILRNRCIWLIADHRAIRGPQQVPSTWVLSTTMRALEGFDGEADRCPRPESEVKLLNALVEYYATTVVAERLGPAVRQWIDGTAEDMLDAMRLPKNDFSAVRGFIAGLAHSEMIEQLVRLGLLRTDPAEIRKRPFNSFQH